MKTEISELTRLYRKLSGLSFANVEKQISSVPPEKRPFMYRKLIWNIPRGRLIRYANQYAKDFAYIICNIALLTGLDIYADDIIPDGILNYDDFITHRDIIFAHKIIKDCEHFETVLSYLLSEEDEGFICEGDEIIHIALDTK